MNFKGLSWNMLSNFTKITAKEVRRRKMRSFLTLVGIIIGIGAIVSLLMLGQGLENAIAEQFSALGNDKLFITARGNSLTPGISIDAVKITEDDLEVIRDTRGVEQAAGFIFTSGRVEFNDNVRYFFVSGMPTEPEERALIGEANSFKIAQGRSFQKGDKFKAVVGYAYTEKPLFDRAVDVGSKIMIQDQEFNVIGILEKIGSPPDDQSVQIPLEAYKDIFDSGDELGILVAQTLAGEEINIVADEVTKELRKHRDIEEGKEDFNVETPEQLASTFTAILDVVQAVLIGIAAISLLVGGIGIMNTMYTTVLQRTKEIGVMKAIGARNEHVLVMFLIESGVYGLVGGIIGAIGGILLAKGVEAAFVVAVGPAFLSVVINPSLIIGALTFAFVVGVLSGIAPAYRASKLNPVDALRYE